MDELCLELIQEIQSHLNDRDYHQSRAISSVFNQALLISEHRRREQERMHRIYAGEDLIKLAVDGDLIGIMYLAEHRLDIHAQFDLALIWTTRYGHLPVVKYLVEHGVDLGG